MLSSKLQIKSDDRDFNDLGCIWKLRTGNQESMNLTFLFIFNKQK